MRFETDEDRWRRALKETGQQEVMRQLTCYPGQPGDVLTNLPLLPPYPTRAFCQQWCEEQDAREIRPLFTLPIFFGLLAVLFVSYAACTLASYVNTPTPTMGGVQASSAAPTPGPF